MKSKIYEVGGCIRDSFLGIESKDIDFVYVLENLEQTVEAGFADMKEYLLDNNYRIFLETPDCFTIRAKFPKDHKNFPLVADFVMARKEISYIENTRKPVLELGTLEDDLIRRDFTVNAMAKDIDGNIIDLFGGQIDLKKMILRTPIDPKITMLDDPLRVIRAIRFSVTKKFKIDIELLLAMSDRKVLDKLFNVVSFERIRSELEKAFKVDVVETWLTLQKVFSTDDLRKMFSENENGIKIWLLPTMKSTK
jgi:poly(A) polymerase